VLAGGAEALSHAPLLFREDAVAWFAELNKADGLTEKVQALTDLRPNFFVPTLGLEQGLTDSFAGLNMGQTAEVLAHIFNISREAADRYALESHERLARAQDEGRLDGEIEPAYAPDGRVFEHDDGVRRDTSLEQLAKLKPSFEPPWGQVTAGNSSQVTDGASWVILASEEAVGRYGLSPLAEIKDSEWAALDPAIMGLGPVLSATPLLQRQRYGLGDIDLWEINEAFAAQVLACLAAWQDDEFCRDVLGYDAAFGRIDRDRLNIDGGAISLGHPVGTSGNRIVLHLANALKARGAKRGIATECIGGGQGGAMLLEAA
jgi:acetyl-CoA C-acetyltransferase